MCKPRARDKHGRLFARVRGGHLSSGSGAARLDCQMLAGDRVFILLQFPLHRLCARSSPADLFNTSIRPAVAVFRFAPRQIVGHPAVDDHFIDLEFVLVCVERSSHFPTSKKLGVRIFPPQEYGRRIQIGSRSPPTRKTRWITCTRRFSSACAPRSARARSMR